MLKDHIYALPTFDKELFTKEQLPTGVVMLVVKSAVDGKELACVIRKDAESKLLDVFRGLLLAAQMYDDSILLSSRPNIQNNQRSSQ